ncbi:hypothetical protein ANCDUO_18925 [Ancylostoma duodenale]|uniref:Amine oxidase domain-containing protein n=1 Tax=Ancylostoma duodenale TaxID=51022 RepID=A0A0C2CMM2_9BILA|nr:hypothetical protein ANCDUO_18925 [Ancylostoma duodenale]
MMKVFLEYSKPWWPLDVDAIAPLQSNSPLAESFPVFQPLYWNNKILVAWVSGKGPGLISNLEDEELVDGITQHLREALGDQAIPRPVRIFRHSWITDPLVGGSYSYLTPLSVKSVPDAFARMAEPILIDDKPILCFAGEHTHPTMYQTTIGAYESGEREARRIIDYISQEGS